MIQNVNHLRDRCCRKLYIHSYVGNNLSTLKHSPSRESIFPIDCKRRRTHLTVSVAPDTQNSAGVLFWFQPSTQSPSSMPAWRISLLHCLEAACSSQWLQQNDTATACLLTGSRSDYIVTSQQHQPARLSSVVVWPRLSSMSCTVDASFIIAPIPSHSSHAAAAAFIVVVNIHWMDERLIILTVAVANNHGPKQNVRHWWTFACIFVIQQLKRGQQNGANVELSVRGFPIFLPSLIRALGLWVYCLKASLWFPIESLLSLDTYLQQFGSNLNCNFRTDISLQSTSMCDIRTNWKNVFQEIDLINTRQGPPQWSHESNNIQQTTDRHQTSHLKSIKSVSTVRECHLSVCMSVYSARPQKPPVDDGWTELRRLQMKILDCEKDTIKNKSRRVAFSFVII